LTETQFQAEVEGWLDERRLFWHHCPDSRRCAGPRGFPDLLVAGPRGLLVAELKVDGGELSPDQRRWARVLTSTVDCRTCLEYEQPAVTYRVWQPADEENIKAELSRLA
jgi:hypothetical protein